MFRLTNEEKFLIKLVVFVFIGLLFVYYAQKIERETAQKTIESAELLSTNEEGYSISFNGEIHYYTWD